MENLARIIFLALLMGALGGITRADTAPITGTAFQQSAAAESFTIMGPGINIFSTTVDFLSELPLSCIPGSICNMTIAVASCGNFESLPGCVVFGNASGSVNGLAANAIGGELIFTGSAFIPTTTLPNDTMTIPITLAGTLQGYSLTLPVSQLPPPLWNLDISGTGEATFFGTFPGIFSDVNYTFTDNAVATPEPATLLLLSTGLLGALGVRRKR